MAGRSVLFVDDDRFFLHAVGDFLLERGYRVRRAEDGLAALQAVREEPPDVILLDLIMPKIDGGRVCRYLREDPRFQHIPIVVFSALAARDIARLPDVSADAYVAKGPLHVVTGNVLAAIQHLEVHGRSVPAEEAIFGYEGFRPRRLVTELLSLRRDSDLLLQMMSEGVLKADEVDRIFFVSPQAVALLERPESELIGASLWEAFGPAHRAEVERLSGGLRGDPRAKKQELLLDLKARLLKAGFAPLRDGENYEGLLVLLEDISYSRRAQNI
jgi:CheY-like chemotaxis protein